MRIIWPLVSRARYDALLWQLSQARLTAHVAETTIQHLMDRRLEHVTKMAKTAMEIKGHKEDIAELKKEIARLERARVIDGVPV